MSSRNYTQLLQESKKQLDKLEKRQRQIQRLRNITFHSSPSDEVRQKESTEAQVRLAGLTDYYRMRKGWGSFLRGCLGVILLFNILLVVAVGLNKLQFQDEWFLRIVLTTNLADIIGLVYLVVKFLFSHQIETSSKKSVTKSKIKL